MNIEETIWMEIACNSFNDNRHKFNEKQLLLANYIDLFTEIEGGASIFIYNKIPSIEFDSYINTLNYFGLDVLSNKLNSVKLIMDNDTDNLSETWNEYYKRLNLESKFIEIDELVENLDLGLRINDWIKENQVDLSENLQI